MPRPVVSFSLHFNPITAKYVKLPADVPQQPRFLRTIRPYTAADVVAKRGTLPIQYPSDVMAKKLYKILEAKARGEGGGTTFTYGASVYPKHG